jgi:hypothetical protein
MNTNILDAAAALSDGALLARIDALARSERETTTELVAHLAALEIRPSAYAARGYGTLFDYCTQALGLSEDAACNRIGAARTCRQFPIVLELLANGSITLTTIRILQPHLTAANHAAVLARAANQKRGEIELLAAELEPRPDVRSSVRKLPIRAESALWPAAESRSLDGDGSPSIAADCGSARVPVPSPGECTAPTTADTPGDLSRQGHAWQAHRGPPRNDPSSGPGHRTAIGCSSRWARTRTTTSGVSRTSFAARSRMAIQA